MSRIHSVISSIFHSNKIKVTALGAMVLTIASLIAIVHMHGTTEQYRTTAHVLKKSVSEGNSSKSTPKLQTSALPSQSQAGLASNDSQTANTPNTSATNANSTVATTSTNKAVVGGPPVTTEVVTSPPLSTQTSSGAPDNSPLPVGPPAGIAGPSTLTIAVGALSQSYVASTIDGSSVLWQPQNIPGMPSDVYIVADGSGVTKTPSQIFQIRATDNAVVGQVYWVYLWINSDTIYPMAVTVTE